MSPIIRALAVSFLLLAISGLNLVDANSSGKTGKSSSGCTCHNTDAMIVPTMNGLPSSYTPGATYSLSWSGSGMSSNGQGGFNLDASSGSWSNLGSQVQLSSGELTHNNDGQRSWTADWTAPAVGTGDVTFDLAVLYANANSMNTGDNWGTDSWTATEGAAPPTNTPPVASNLMITPNGNVEVNKSFTLSYTYFDDDGDLEGTTQIEWYVDGVKRSSFNDVETIPSSATIVGESWTAKVTPHDGTEFGATANSPDSADIIDIDSDGDGISDGEDPFPNNVAPVASSLMLTPNGNVEVNKSITLSYTYSDQDNNPEAGSQIRWYADGVPKSSFNDMLTIPSSATSVDETWTVTVTPHDGTELGVAVNCQDSAVIIDIDSDGDGLLDEDDPFPNNVAPVASSLMLTPNGNVEVNKSITLSYMFSDQENDADTGSQIRWYIDGNLDLSFNDLLTIPSSATSIGETWTVTVTPNDGTELGETVTSQDSAVIIDIDSDGDGTLDQNDAFKFDSNETMDSDGDGVGDNADAFDNDANETMDSDGDGVGDNSDAFINDGNETMDSDGDGVGDNADAFDNDASETIDSDGDGVGDNSDAFINDGNETMDSDGDGVGDNADAFPNDETETLDTDGDGVGDNAQLAAELAAVSEEDEDSNLMLIIGIVVLVIAGVVGAILFMRKGDDNMTTKDTPDEFTQQLMPGQFKAFQPTHTEAHISAPQQVVAQAAAVATVAEPAVVQQWTDEKGNTWRSMDNGTTLWWNGTDWQQV